MKKEVNVIIFLAITIILISSVTAFSFQDIINFFKKPNLSPEDCSSSSQKIFISQATGSDNNLGTRDKPIKTLDKAKQIAISSSAPEFCILLNGGEIFNQFSINKNSNIKEGERDTFAFIWDINKALVLTNYGNGKAILTQSKSSSNGAPGGAIAIIGITKGVKISNLELNQWQTNGIFVRYSENVKIENNKISNLGTKYFSDSNNANLYGAGALYIKDSKNINLTNNILINLHNQKEQAAELHAFYLTRTKDMEIKNNIIINSSGPPIKVRRTTDNILIENNQFYYTGPEKSLGASQEGWLRYSGDSADKCPTKIVVKNNKFYFPFCDGKKCTNAVAIKCSSSNCNDCNRGVDWGSNDFKYNWEKIDINLPEEPIHIYFYDFDNDNYGISTNNKTLPAPEGNYRALQKGDCNDADASIHPDAIEICDSKDNNCNSQIDEVCKFCNNNKICEANENIQNCPNDCQCNIKEDCEDNNPCTIKTCSLTHRCILTNNTNSCNDNNECTANDVCSNGICKGMQINCNDNISCTIDSCRNGKCFYDSTQCGCVTNEDCNDENQCTVDKCILNKCQSTFSEAPCDDRNKFTVNDKCSEGECNGRNIAPKIQKFKNTLSTNINSLDTLSGVKDFMLGMPRKAQIKFGQEVNLTEVNLDSYINIKDNSVSLDSDELPTLNVPAEIIFYDINLKNPQIMADGKSCADCKIINYKNNTLTISVQHFTTYSIVEGEYCGDNICNNKENCSTCSEDCKNCSIQKCISEWQCKAWNKCISYKQTRICADKNNCTEQNTKQEEQFCQNEVNNNISNMDNKNKPIIKKDVPWLMIILITLLIVLVLFVFFSTFGSDYIEKIKKMFKRER